MKITQISRSVKGLYENDYRDALIIKVDDKTVFDVYDGESEDANLSRDFSDCFKVVDLMRMAYKAGQRGESFDFEAYEKTNF